MIILVDTNVLLRYVEQAHPQRPQASVGIESLRANGHELAVVPQVIYEFWVVATRPKEQNGLGFAIDRADAEVASILALYPIFDDETGILDLWRITVTRHGVVGKRAHDARLAAAMLRHRISHLLSFNVQDFARFSEINVISPDGAATFPPA